MNASPLKVLVVDDSALMRNLVSRIVDHEPDMTAIGKAMNGRFALNKLESLDPDVIILDLEMPDMNGIEFLRERRTRKIDIPVVVLSAVAQKGASITMEALGAGAADFIPKPSGTDPDEIRSIGSQLAEMIRSYGTKYRRDCGKPKVCNKPDAKPAPSDSAAAGKPPAPSAAAGRDPSSRLSSGLPTQPPRRKRSGSPGPVEIIAIGISTGGPNALRQVFSQLDPSIRTPILVVQHMPPGFTSEFAKSLDRICPMEVKEAQEGDLVKPGRILIAPGDFHLTVERRSLATIVHINEEAPVNGHRPSADVLFSSVAKVYGNRALGVIMTGMGRDGADKLGEIYEAGGLTLGQDAASSVVYGMPRVAFEYGNVVRQVPLDEMAGAIANSIRELSPA